MVTVTFYVINKEKKKIKEIDSNINFCFKLVPALYVFLGI